MRDLVHLANVAVLSVDYRLAPEHKFPSGLSDACTAIQYAQSQGATWKVDTTRMTAGGDSAGSESSFGIRHDPARSRRKAFEIVAAVLWRFLKSKLDQSGKRCLWPVANADGVGLVDLSRLAEPA